MPMFVWLVLIATLDYAQDGRLKGAGFPCLCQPGLRDVARASRAPVVRAEGPAQCGWRGGETATGVVDSNRARNMTRYSATSSDEVS
jgi:hypothetical protein